VALRRALALRITSGLSLTVGSRASFSLAIIAAMAGGQAGKISAAISNQQSAISNQRSDIEAGSRNKPCLMSASGRKRM